MTRSLLCAGEAFDDLVFVGLERLPRPGEEVRTNQFSATIGGGAVITAVAASRLGVSVSLASALSAAAEARLRSEGIGVTNLRKNGEAHAITAALSVGTERAFVTFDGVNPSLDARLEPVLEKTRASHVHLALYPRNTRQWRRRMERLRKRGITTSCDFGWNDALARDPGLPGLLDAMDIVFVNERETMLYAATRDFERALNVWRNEQSIVVMKLGAEGSRCVGAGGEYHAAGQEVVPVDTTGAGDAFNGGFLAAWLRGARLADCLQAGNKIGAASTRKAGGIDALPGKAKRQKPEVRSQERR